MVDTEVTAIPAAKGDRSHGHGCEGEPQPRLRAAASAAKGEPLPWLATLPSSGRLDVPITQSWVGGLGSTRQ